MPTILVNNLILKGHNSKSKNKWGACVDLLNTYEHFFLKKINIFKYIAKLFLNMFIFFVFKKRKAFVGIR